MFTCDILQVSVENCPSQTFSVSLYLVLKPRNVDEDSIRQKFICQYGVNPMEAKISLKTLIDDKLCADYYIKSGDVSGRCLPGVNLGEELPDAISNQPFARFSTNDLNEGKKVLASLSTGEDYAMLMFQYFKSTWPFMLEGLVTAMLISFIWILLMKWIAGIIIWLTILCLVIGLPFGTYYCFSRCVELWGSLDVELESEYDITDWFRKNLSIYGWLIVGVVFLLLHLLFPMLIFFRPCIITVIKLIEEASKAVALMPLVLFFQLLTCLLHVLVLAFWGSVTVYLASSGRSDYRYWDVWTNNMTTANSSQPESNGTLSLLRGYVDRLKCELTLYIVNHNLSGQEVLLYLAQIYIFFVFKWIISFADGLSHMALAAAFSSYYWTFRKPQNVPFFAVLNGLCLTARYHLGSVAFGSLIVASGFPIHLVLQCTDSRPKKYDNRFTRCCKCCLRWLVNFIKVPNCWNSSKNSKCSNKTAYAMIAMHGEDFCASINDAFMLLKRKADRSPFGGVLVEWCPGRGGVLVAVLGRVMGFLLMIGQFVIVGTVAILSFHIFNRRVDAFNKYPPELYYYLVPVATVSYAAYVITSRFSSVYIVAVNTFYLCLLEDCERNDSSKEKPYFMSKELMKILGKKNKFRDVESECERGHCDGTSQNYETAQ